MPRQTAAPLLPATAHRESFFAVKALHALPVHRPTLAAKLVVDEPIAPSRALARDDPDPCTELVLRLPNGSITDRRARKAREPHGSTL
jgi:hypothetical protein